MNKLQKAFSEIAKVHNTAFEESRNINTIIANNNTLNAKAQLPEELDPNSRELDKQGIFWQRMRNTQRDQIGEIVHEAVRSHQVIEIANMEELVAIIDFFAERGVEGHKIISISNELERTEIVHEFLKAYCSENRYLISKIRYELLD